MTTLNEKQKLAYNLMRNGKNVFITGGGGVGKSWLINHFVKNTYKKVAITSTTGVSAVIIGGATIHSYLGIGLGTQSINQLVSNIRKKAFYRERWRTIDILVIDEISMLNPELFDKLNEIAQIIRNNIIPFGGMQLILSGDFCQLPCVGSENFCFEAETWEETVDNTIYLTDIIRQNDLNFQNCLNQIRMGRKSKEVKNIINKRVKAKFDKKNEIKPTKLYPLNSSVDYINDKELEKLVEKNGDVFEYQLEFHNLTKRKLDPNKFMKSCLIQNQLQLTINCQVMLIYNLDPENELVNGSRGVVVRFENDLPVVQFMNGSQRIIDYNVWEFKDDDKVIATICQIPLKLGYAFSIHKSQGCTIDYAKVDLSNIFEYGMGYVALSRVKSLEGLSIINIDWKNIKCNPKAKKFYKELEKNVNSESVFTSD